MSSITTVKPLKVALVHADRPRAMENRMIGWWAYDVPQFHVTRFPIPKKKRQTIDVARLAERFDVIFWEDYQCYPRWVHTGALPIVYQVGDSVLSEKHRQNRQKAARDADLILVKRDRLTHFRDIAPTRRGSDCVNDRLFYDRHLPKDIDVCYHVRGNTERRKAVGRFLQDFCAEHELTCAFGKRFNEEYAQAFNRSRISVNVIDWWRNQRFFDVMAAYSCLLTTPPKPVSEEDYLRGIHYLEWTDFHGLGNEILYTLDTGRWKHITQYGHDYVMRKHTWAARARRVRCLLREELGL